jgi:hypothetical protein
MKIKNKQSGVTLIVSLIMLVALTLLVVSAIRTGNTNLRIVGNMQVESETAAAAQQAVEQVISSDFTAAPVAEDIPVTMGPVTYTVNVAAPECTHSVPVAKGELDATDPDDQLCFAEQDPLAVVGADGKQVYNASKCKTQAWEVEANVSDTGTGASTGLVQGISRRTYLPTAC